MECIPLSHARFSAFVLTLFFQQHARHAWIFRDVMYRRRFLIRLFRPTILFQATYLVDSLTDKTKNNKVLNIGGPDDGLTMTDQGNLVRSWIARNLLWPVQRIAQKKAGSRMTCATIVLYGRGTPQETR